MDEQTPSQIMDEQTPSQIMDKQKQSQIMDEFRRRVGMSEEKLKGFEEEISQSHGSEQKPSQIMDEFRRRIGISEEQVKQREEEIIQHQGSEEKTSQIMDEEKLKGSEEELTSMTKMLQMSDGMLFQKEQELEKCKREDNRMTALTKELQELYTFTQKQLLDKDKELATALANQRSDERKQDNINYKFQELDKCLEISKELGTIKGKLRGTGRKLDVRVSGQTDMDCSECKKLVIACMRQLLIKDIEIGNLKAKLRVCGGVTDPHKSQIDFNLVKRMRIDLKFNPNTADPRLVFRADHRSVRWVKDTANLTDVENKYFGTYVVWGTKGFTSGRQYWEIEVDEGSIWSVGISALNFRTQKWIRPSQREEYWAVVLWNIGEKLFTTRSLGLFVRIVELLKIGIYLNSDAGTVTFYNPENASPVYKFTAKFFGIMYPVFRFIFAKSGYNSLSVAE
ncbi:E3 ubiquitin-protein ligase TRIM39-like isoform X2 [Scyliorhinus canicula]|uniref:E3 ubiquitin-protein ligase TRIM39-like isoform X2 n=1 Tax=Scyliorhinus canicula TaxID=7830 RepID=UPI0018F2D96E|nr:E3 ubiquitin-protein ligase TRIM39-like isoform X2 [Scyliorhinus canicula]